MTEDYQEDCALQLSGHCAQQWPHYSRPGAPGPTGFRRCQLTCGTLRASSSTPPPISEQPGRHAHRPRLCGASPLRGASHLLILSAKARRSALGSVAMARRRLVQASRVAGCAHSGAPALRRAAAAHAALDASPFICQSWLETSVFPPSTLKSPRGRPTLRAAAPAGPHGTRPGLQGAAREKGVGPPRNCPPDACTTGALFPGAQTSGRKERRRMTR